MLKIDAHQHFWKYDAVRDSWIDESMYTIRRDFMPRDVSPLLTKYQVAGCVAIQADQSETETDFLLSLAADNDFIKGVVGWVDLRSPNITERLEHYSTFEKIKGFRHILQGEPDRALMLNPAFMKGITALKNYDFTYDILIIPDQLGFTNQFIKTFPSQRFVIDHIAKPDIKHKNMDKWGNAIKAVAKHENVSCKISGMITEADWKDWTMADIEPYLDIVFEAFGSKRVMFGSDWPVCNLAGGYDQMMLVVKNYASKLSANEQARFWGLNATEFYKLN
ncbi:amidohydrolase family protein [Mucilaginibacter sp.]|uniref:amidohydrolase family protein n=1 Tax=Mucilaginibacter sp. TaxID=1882438 RepID=UPI003D151FC7